MKESALIGKIRAVVHDLSPESKHAILVSAEMISEGMNIPNNIDYFRSRLIGTETDKDFQVKAALEVYSKPN